MIDTGMNRLGLRPTEIDLLEGLKIETFHSHLACADEDSPLNAMQLERFRAVRSAVAARRYSIANSAGIASVAITASISSVPGYRFTAAFRGPNLKATSGKWRA